MKHGELQGSQSKYNAKRGSIRQISRYHLDDLRLSNVHIIILPRTPHFEPFINDIVSMADSTEFDVFEGIDVDFDALLIDAKAPKYPGMYCIIAFTVQRYIEHHHIYGHYSFDSVESIRVPLLVF